MATFAERLRQLRDETKISQEELGKLLGSSQRHMSRIENEAVLPNLELAIALAEYFDVSLDYLAGRSDERRVEREPCPEIDSELTALTPTAIEAARIVNRVGEDDQRFAIQMLQFTVTELELRSRKRNNRPLAE